MSGDPRHGDERCPFCRLLAGEETETNRQADVVHRDQHTAAFVSPKWWTSNPAHVLVVPTQHFENLYAISDDALGRVYVTAKRVAAALKSAYQCDGVSTRQHNDPGGGQDVGHFHVHVFPRYTGDELYEKNAFTRWTTPAERVAYAERLRDALRAL